MSAGLAARRRALAPLGVAGLVLFVTLSTLAYGVRPAYAADEVTRGWSGTALRGISGFVTVKLATVSVRPGDGVTGYIRFSQPEPPIPNADGYSHYSAYWKCGTWTSDAQAGRANLRQIILWVPLGSDSPIVRSCSLYLWGDNDLVVYESLVNVNYDEGYGLPVFPVSPPPASPSPDPSASPAPSATPDPSASPSPTPCFVELPPGYEGPPAPTTCPSPSPSPTPADPPDGTCSITVTGTGSTALGTCTGPLAYNDDVWRTKVTLSSVPAGACRLTTYAGFTGATNVMMANYQHTSGCVISPFSPHTSIDLDNEATTTVTGRSSAGANLMGTLSVQYAPATGTVALFEFWLQSWGAGRVAASAVPSPDPSATPVPTTGPYGHGEDAGTPPPDGPQYYQPGTGTGVGGGPGGSAGPCVPGPLTGECKPGSGYASMPSCPNPFPSLNPLDYFAWIGCLLSGIPTAIGNGLTWLLNGLADLFMPAEMGAFALAPGAFMEMVSDKAPFGYVPQVQAALAPASWAGPAPGLSFSIAGTTINAAPPLTAAVGSLAPFRGVFVAFFWFITALAILRLLRGAVGGGDSGGGGG